MFEKAKSKILIIRELFGFLWRRKLYWLIPMVAALVLLGLLIGLSSGSSVSPFIYTLF